MADLSTVLSVSKKRESKFLAALKACIFLQKSLLFLVFFRMTITESERGGGGEVPSSSIELASMLFQGDFVCLAKTQNLVLLRYR